jgi:predicted regulator of Ras-like GTPase activity (Roadblock/LC7/MglB family)
MSENSIHSKWDELINTALKNLSPRPKEAAIISIGGLQRAIYIEGNYSPEEQEIRQYESRVAGMSAAMLSLGERISAELSLSTFQETIIYGSDGVAILVSREEWVLATKFKSIDSLDDILFQLRATTLVIEALAKSLGLTLNPL